MSIHVNQKRKQYFICYKATLEDGTQKTITITNAEWKTNLVGKKYMQSIEQDEIEKDKKKRKLRIKRKDGSIITLEELRTDFTIYQYNRLKKSSAYAKETMFNKYIYSYFKTNKPLYEIFTIQSINGFINHLSKINDVSKNTLNFILAILKESIEFAMRNEYLAYEIGNKLTLVIVPFSLSSEIKPNKVKVWTKEELDIFFNSFEETDKYYYLFDLLYKGALRLGEAIALKWEDLDPINNTIHIYKTVTVFGELTTPKTSSSKDYVYLPKSCVNNLLKLKELMKAEDDDFMFFGSKHIHRDSVNKYMDYKIKKLNLPHLSPHGLRHSCATTMLYKGVPIHDISHHLRHSDIGITLKTYVHWIKKDYESIMENVFD